MTVKITAEEPNIFPAVEDVDARDNGRDAAVFLGMKIDGQFVTVTINLSYEQASALAALLEPFRNE
jgi:hypothetical protein